MLTLCSGSVLVIPHQYEQNKDYFNDLLNVLNDNLNVCRITAVFLSIMRGKANNVWEKNQLVEMSWNNLQLIICERKR